MPKVVVAGRILVMVAEWDRRMNQTYGVIRHPPHLIHTVIIDQRPVFTFDFHSLNSYRPCHPLSLYIVQQAEVLDNLAHFLLQFVVILPILQQYPPDLFFRFRENHVDNDLLLLQEAVYPVDCLNEIVEFIVNAHEDSPVTMPLEIAPGTGKAFLRGKQSGLSIGECGDPPFPLVVVHGAVDIHHTWNLFQNSLPLIFQVMPQQEMRLRVTGYNLSGHPNPLKHRFPFLFCGVLEAHSGLTHQLYLPILVHHVTDVGLNHVHPHIQRRQVVSGSVIA